MRNALRTTVELELDMQVVGEAGDGRQGVALALALRPNVTIMDLYLPIMNGMDAIKEIIASDSNARILAITRSVDDGDMIAAVEAGAKGYLIKDAPRQSFILGLRDLAAGKLFFPPEVAEKLARAHATFAPALRPGDPPVPLTHREREVLCMMADGLSDLGIASCLYLSESTVRVHMVNLMHKLGIADREGVMVYALTHPFCDNPD